MLVLEPLRGSTFACQDQLLPETGLGIPGSSYNVICGLVAAFAGPEGVWEWLFCEPRPAVTAISPGHPESCHHLPAVHKAQPLKESQEVWELNATGSHGVTSMG